MPGRLENVVLPGPELEPTPRTDRKRPVVIQSLTAYPHGTAFSYDIEYYGLDPGTYNLADYLRHRPLPFYPWLRQLARQRLQAIRRHHLDADRRSVLREAPATLGLPDQSAAELANLLLAGGSSPSRVRIRQASPRRRSSSR